MRTTSLRIVVADKDEDMRCYYSRILPSLGHAAIAVTSDGTELVRRAEECDPDLVITDLIRPLTNGLEILTRIKETVPYIVISTFDQPEDYVLNQLRSLVAYLVKPVAKEDIKAAIDRAAQILSSRDGDVSGTENGA